MALEDLKNQGNIIDGQQGGDPLLGQEPVTKDDFVFKVPKTVTQAGMTPREQRFNNSALQAFSKAGPQVQGEFQDFDPELDRGAMSGMDQHELRAENQGSGDEFKAGAFQFANELVLGTAEQAALMLDVGMHADAIMGAEQDFSNTLSEKLREVKEGLNEEYGKVYVSEDNEGFNPGSGEFWASNAASMASALTLMIPSTGAVKALGAVAKGTKLMRAARIGKAGQGAIKGLTAATLSRFTENAMEASGAVEATRAELTGQTNPQTGKEFTKEEIDKVAGEAGLNTWRAGWAMMATDVIQYSKMFKGLDFARRTASTVGAKTGLKGALATAGSFVAKDMGGEGLEEGYQFLASEEATRAAKERVGIKDGTKFLERLGDYIHEDEFKTSMLLGAVGGGMFGSVGKINEHLETQKQIKNRRMVENLHAQNDAVLTGDPESFEKSDDITLVGDAITKAAEGNLDMLEADLAELQYEPNDSLIEQGLDPDEYRAKVTRARKLVKRVGKEYNAVRNMDIPVEVQGPMLQARMERVVNEQRRSELSEAIELLENEDKTIFEGKEKSTASQMVKLKRLIRNKNTGKAAKLADSIAESSDVYNEPKDVLAALKTPQDEGYAQVAEYDKAYTDNIEQAEKVETQLKTPEGQAAVLAEAKSASKKKANKRRKAKQEKEEAEASAAKNKKDLTPEQAVYQGVVAKAEEDFGTYATPEPDGTNVFTTTTKSGPRTWVKGETVRDKNGKEYTVSNPIKARGGKVNIGVNVYDNSGKKGKSVKFSNEDMLKLSPESLKKGQQDWTVNEFKFENKKKIDAVKANEIRKENDVYDGIVKGINIEFDNFGTPGQGINEPRFFPEGEAPSVNSREAYDIDYDLAASVMPESIQKVSLEADDSKGFPAILVKQDGKIITKLEMKGVESQFDTLLEYIGSKGGSIEGAIKDKHVNFVGNLANMKGAKNSVELFQGTEFLPDGKIFIGSVKHGESNVKFVSPDGDVKDVPWNQIKAAAKGLEGKKTGEGNTFMLMLTPNGTEVPVMLNETRLDDIKDASGRSESDKIVKGLNEAAVKAQTEVIDAAIKKYIEGGMLESVAIKKVAESEEIQSMLKDMSSDVIGDSVRIQTKLHKFKTPNGKEVNQPRSSHFDLKLVYTPEITEVNGIKTYKPGRVVVQMNRAVPSKHEGGGYYQEKSTDPTVVSEAIGQRFANVSIDTMVGEGGGAYITKAIKNNWFTTDVYHKRPWVNPRITIQLDADAVSATKGNAKKRDVPNSRKSQPKKKASGTVAQNESNDAMTSAAVKTANKNVRNITDFMNDKNRAKYEENGKGITIEEFVKEYLNDAVDPAEFLAEIQAEGKSLDSGQSLQQDYMTVTRKKVKEIISENFESGAFDNLSENSNGEAFAETVIDETTQILLDSGKTQKQIDGMSPAAKRILVKIEKSKEVSSVEKTNLEVVKEEAVTPKQKFNRTTPSDLSGMRRNMAPTSIFSGLTSDPNSKFYNFTSAKVEPIVRKAIKKLSDKIEKFLAGDLNLEGIEIVGDLGKLKSIDPILRYWKQNATDSLKDYISMRDGKEIDVTLYDFIYSEKKEVASKPVVGKKKKINFGKPKVKVQKVAKEQASPSEIGKVEAVDTQSFDNLLESFNDIKIAGDALSAEAKTQIKKEATVKCK